MVCYLHERCLTWKPSYRNFEFRCRIHWPIPIWNSTCWYLTLPYIPGVIGRRPVTIRAGSARICIPTSVPAKMLISSRWPPICRVWSTNKCPIWTSKTEERCYSCSRWPTSPCNPICRMSPPGSRVEVRHVWIVDYWDLFRARHPIKRRHWEFKRQGLLPDEQSLKDLNT